MKTLIKPLMILCGFLFLGQVSIAQDNHNVIDNNGLKQGLWIVYGIDRLGEGWANDGIVEEGSYEDNRKQGLWTKYHFDGKTARLKANYVNGHPFGEYKKFNKLGILVKEGRFENKQQKGIYKTYDDGGNLITEKYFNEDGKIDGREVF